MVRNKLAAAILGAGLLMPGLAGALGVGDFTLKSYLNQPLDLEIDLIQTKDLSTEEVVAGLASEEEFNAAGVERAYLLTDIRFEIVQKPDGTMSVVARSRKPINEPFLNFLVVVQWPQGRLVREYTVLLDPPVYKSGDAQTATAAPIVASDLAAAPAPASAPVTVPAAPVVVTAASQPDQAVSDLPPPPPPPAGTTVREQAGAGKRVEQQQQQSQSPAGAAGDYRVVAGDTMMEIARQNRPAGVSVQQTMIAIQRANPEAFINGNVNLVKKGKVLRIPGEAEIQQVSTREAREDIASQNRAWRELLDSRGIVMPSGEAQLQAGKASAPVAAAPKGTGQGQVTLVAPGAAGKGGKAAGGKDVAALQNQLAITGEGVKKAQAENKDLGKRLGDLDGKIKENERLVKAKDDQLARLQDELAKLKSADAAKAPAEAAGEPAAVPAEEKPVAEKPKPKPKPIKPAAAEPVEVVEPAPAAPMWPLLVGGLVVLGGIGGAVMMFLRRRNAAAAPAPAAVDTEAEIADDLAQLQDLNVGLGDEDHEDAPAAEGEGSGDPLGEADMYMAYGRFQQAADILYAALQREPERNDIRLKLAEVYLEMGETAQAKDQATQLEKGGDAGMRKQAQALLARIGGGAAAAPAAAAAETELSLDDLALEFSGGGQEAAAPAAPAADDDFSLDLDDVATADDLNLDYTPPPAKAAAPAAARDELEFSLDDMAPTQSVPAVAAPAAKPSLGELAFDDANLEELSFEETPAPAAPAEEFSLEDAASDFDLTLDEEPVAAAPAPAPAPARAPAPAPAPAPAADLDLESELADLQADLSVEGVSGNADGDDFDFLADSDENATKLDLARAYIDMGDAEGARDILNEVMAEGNATQKADAQKLLAQVG